MVMNLLTCPEFVCSMFIVGSFSNSTGNTGVVASHVHNQVQNYSLSALE
jgi:hypothetical protein